MKERAKKYFILADQYSESVKLLLETLIENENSNAGIGMSYEEAYAEMRNNVIKSDVYLFVPALFCFLQSTELYLKGLLLLNGIEIATKHDVQGLFDKLQQIYTKNSDIYKEFHNMYYSQKDIIKKYKVKNNITNTHELYMSLRYPENSGVVYDYCELMYNGDAGINLYKKIHKSLENIQQMVLKEYRNIECSIISQI